MGRISELKLNFIYNTSYQILKMIVPLVTTPYIARTLGPEGTGAYSYANSIAAYFVMFAMLGVNNYGSRSIAMVKDNKEALSQKFWSIYYLQLLSSTVMVAAYILYLVALCDDKAMGWILLLYVLSAALDISWFFSGLENFKLIVLRNIVIQIATVVLVFTFVNKREDVYIYAFIYAASMIVQQAILWRYVFERVTKVRISCTDIIVHIKPVCILFIPLLSVSLYKVMDKIMLGWISTKTEVGYYEACEKICAIPSSIIVSLGNVMLPRMANLFSKNDEEKSREYIHKSMILAMFFSSAICFGIMSVSDEFVPLYYGAGYEKCILLFKILLPSSIFVSFANVIRTQYLIPREQDITYIISVSLGAVVNIILNILLIPSLGSIGAALGTLAAEMAVCVYQSIAVCKKLDIKKYLFDTVPFISIGILMFIIVRAINLQIENTLIVLCIKVFAGAVFYLTAAAIVTRKRLKGMVINMQNKDVKRYYKIDMLMKIRIKLFLDSIRAKKTFDQVFEASRKEEPIDIENPKTFDDKLWYMKKHFYSSLAAKCADKVQVREYVKECGFEDILIPLYGVYASADEIDFQGIPEECYIKCNHTSGSNYLYRKGQTDIKWLKKLFTLHLKRNYYNVSKEWVYRDISPRIVVEKVLKSKEMLKDYRLFCFDGELKLVMVNIGTATEQGEHAKDVHRSFYTPQFEWIPELTIKGDKPAEYVLEPPENWNKMVEIAKVLSAPFAFCRVDLYNIEGTIYFSELTFFPNAGINHFQPDEWALQLGDWIDLERCKKNPAYEYKD